MWWLFIGLGLWACGSEEPDKVLETRAVEISSATVNAEATNELVQLPLTYENLDPKFAVVVAPDRAPEGITLSFARPVVEKDSLKAELEISPPVVGNWVWIMDEFLQFTPTNGFKPNTKYTAKLTSLTNDGEALGDISAIPSVSFQTPDFEFQSARVTSKNWSVLRAEAIFSGPVKGNLELGLSATVNGQASSSNRGSPVRVSASAAGSNRVSYRIDSRGIRDAASVQISIPSYEGLNGARSESVTYTLVGAQSDTPMRIEKIARQEGETSQIISVICNDGAVEHNRYFYERGYSGYISTRCLLDADRAGDFIEIYPKIDYKITGGRGGFNVVGDFQRGPVFLRINKGAPTVDGGILRDMVETVLYMPGLQPKVEFAHSGRYLPKSSWRGMAIRHRNVDEVGVQVRRVPKENLLYWLSGEDERTDHRTSDLVADTRFPVRGGEDEMITTFVDLQDHVPAAELGVYEISVVGGVAVTKEQRADRDTGMSDDDEQDATYKISWSSRAVSRILLTDINLVVKSNAPTDGKWSPKHKVWALDMKTNAAISGVEIEVVKASGNVMSRCVTGSDGGCVVSVSGDGIDPSGPIALFASKGSDFTYLKFNELRINNADSAVHGESYLSDKPYRGSIYLDRGVFRPGDEVHVSGIIRGDSLIAPTAEMPVVLKLTDPRNKLVRKVTLTTSPSGMISYDHKFADFAPTGSYQVSLEVAEREIGAQTFSVEEFVPERMKVTAEGKEKNYGMFEQASVLVDAQYLFGGNAGGSPVEMTCNVVPVEFKPRANANFHYGVQVLGYEKAAKPMALGGVQGELDDEGKVTLTCPSSERAGSFRGGAMVNVDVAVFEGGSGRTTRTSASIPVHPDKFYIGLDSGTQKVKANISVPISGVIVDWAGELSNEVSEVEVELFRLVSEWGWNWDAQRQEERYTRYLRPVSEGVRKTPVSRGKFSLKVTAKEDGEAFIIRATSGSIAQTDLRLGGHGRGYWWRPAETRVDQTPRPMKPTSMVITVPDSVEVGGNNEVVFEAPYRGRLLVAVETNELLTSEWIEVSEPGPVKWSFSVNGIVPNVYVSGLLVKDPHLDSAEAYLPDRAFGVESVRVNPTARLINVTLDTPDEVQSNGTLSVKLDIGKTSGPTTVTVAAVDEGILSLTKFKTPDPMVDLFPRRKLDVKTEETIGWAISIPAAGNTSSTGGGGSSPGGRVQAIKPVSLWSGIVEVPESGKVEITLEVPQYQGALRVMAVVADDKRLGVADAQVLVRDPLVLQTTLPRFLMTGDSIQVPVFVTNLSGKEREITVDMSVDPMLGRGIGADEKVPVPVEMIGARSTSFTLADGANKTVVFRAKAKARTGAATFTIQAKSDDLVSREVLDVPFQAHGPRTRQVSTLRLDQGQLDLTDKLSGWVPTTEKTTVWVTSNPYGKALSHLKYVIRYPYGCIEQTTSSTRPLLYVSNLLPAVAPEIVAPGSVDKMVMHGVNRVLSMQTASGGFAYWPGATHANSWGTAYATHMLLDAKEQQYEVPESALKAAISYLESQVVTGDRNSYRNSVAYSHYVLARAGRGQKGRILAELNDLSTAVRGEPEEQAFMLKAALYLAGDRRFEAELRNPKVGSFENVRSNNWSYYSELRKRGFQLSVIQDLFKPTVGGDGEPLAQLVYNNLVSKPSSRYYTTQEIVWSVTALGKRVEVADEDMKPILMLNGKAIPIDGKKKKESHTWTVARASEYSSVALELKETPKVALYAIVTSDGVRDDAVFEEGSSGVAVERLYVDSEGTELDVNSLDLGEVVYTHITVSNKTNARIQNLALVDRFPAGWEIENPRLGRGGLLNFVDSDDLWRAEHLNLRDDRLEMFGALEGGESRQVVYALRAVTSGQFTAPPVEIEAMYDPSIWARQLGQPVTILGKWDDFFL